MNMFGGGDGSGGFQMNPAACSTCGSADPATCFCNNKPSSGAWGGGVNPWAAGGGGGFAQQQQQQQQSAIQMPATVHVIVDSHIYTVNCDGTPIGQIVQTILSQPK